MPIKWNRKNLFFSVPLSWGHYLFTVFCCTTYQLENFPWPYDVLSLVYEYKRSEIIDKLITEMMELKTKKQNHVLKNPEL